MSGRVARRGLLEALLRSALAAVDPGHRVREAVRWRGSQLLLAGAPVAPGKRLAVLAVGKAAAPMAAAVEGVAGERIARGLAITKPGYGLPLRRIQLREAGHPIPDARSETAARDALALVSACHPEEVLVVLLSGGASALLGCPQRGLSLMDLAETTSLLLAAGAEIDELNAVRKHLSEVSGGRLAQHAASHRIEVLAISDVIGDRLDVIGSGPCVADPTTFADALAVLDAYRLTRRVPPAIAAHLERGRSGAIQESPKPGHPAWSRVRTTVLASNRHALAAAVEAAQQHGLLALPVEKPLCGEARKAGRKMAAMARSLRSARPVCLVAGGETTVEVRGPGKGGRNQELALAAALELSGDDRTALLAVGTDGSDGPTDAAGAFVDGETVARGRARGVDARVALDRNDSYSFFQAEGGLLCTGPTRTNVMDLTLALSDP